ncbi:MAG: AMP-binding protein [Lachnospiraceae bacterium]|nr:AMP-binding protein [Lachnospiraceae bacterium]
MWDLGKYSERIALIDEQEVKITYGQLSEIGEDICKNVENRSLVFILCTNSIGSVVGYTAFMNHKIVPLMLNAHLDRELLNELLRIYQPSYLWIPENMTDEFSMFQVVINTCSYSLLKTNYQLKHELYEELALLLTTSGSTGSPKFVRQSYKNIKANTESIISYLKLDENERPITTLPMNYTYGLSIINTHLYVGATILMTERSLMEKEFWTLFKEQKATSFGGVPYTYEMLDRLRFARMDLPYLRTMTQAGGKLSVELHKKFAAYAEENGKEFIVMYGQCEATARMGYLPADQAVKKCGSMGIAIPNGQLSLIDENGKEITEHHKVGELIYRGDNVTLGYAESVADLLKGDERNGVLVTGDMAETDDEGFFYIVGRKKRFLKIYGNRVNLDEIDQMIKSHYTDVDCASIGVDDHMKIIITNPDLVDSVKHYVAEKTKLNPVAFQVKYIPEIPKNDAGKTLYKVLEKYDL